MHAHMHMQALKKTHPPLELQGSKLADLELYHKTKAYSVDKWYGRVGVCIPQLQATHQKLVSYLR
jgi:hypothetical protein